MRFNYASVFVASISFLPSTFSISVCRDYHRSPLLRASRSACLQSESGVCGRLHCYPAISDEGFRYVQRVSVPENERTWNRAFCNAAWRFATSIPPPWLRPVFERGQGTKTRWPGSRGSNLWVSGPFRIFTIYQNIIGRKII